MDRVAEARVCHDGRAELAALHVAAGAHEQRVPAGVEVDHQVRARCLGRRDDQECIGNRCGERLLDEHVLARAQHRHGGVAVQVVGRRDAHRLDGAAGKLVQARRPGATESVAGAAGAVGVTIADHHQPRARVCREGEGVIAAPDARADDAHGHGPAGHRHLTRYTPATAGSSNT